MEHADKLINIVLVVRYITQNGFLNFLSTITDCMCLLSSFIKAIGGELSKNY